MLIENIAAALRTEDVEGLIELGAPEDEYNSEAEHIALALAQFSSDQFTQQNLVAVIALVFAQSFNRSPKEIEQRLPAFNKIASILLG